MLLVKTRLDISQIHGIGLFADQFIPAGTVIWRFSPTFDLHFSEEALDSLAESAREQIRKYSYREQSSGLYVLCGDDARFFNHSGTPNCIDIFNGDAEDVTRACADIFAGQELTCDYALFDLDLIEGRYEITGQASAAEVRRELPEPVPAV